jgi:predicted GTPase
MDDVKKYLDEVAKEESAFDELTVQCGIVGLTGSGKSSLINAIAGKQIAEIGVKETTGVSSPVLAYEFHHVVLIDLPGAGTSQWRTEKYFQRLKKLSPLEGEYSLEVEAFDCFILVVANRILAEDVKLHRLITQKHKKPCFLVRSKFDIDADNNWRTKRKTDQETHDEILDDLWANFPRERREHVFVISTAEPHRGDLAALETAIRRSLPGDKREKFLAYAAAHSEETVKKKRRVAEKRAGRLALASALNAFNPLPGLGLAVDMALLVKLSRDMLEIYGLTEEHLDYETRRDWKHEAWGSTFRRRTIAMVKSFMSEDAILPILARLLPGLEAKEIAKWVPVIGQALASVVGYRLTSAYAQMVIDTCEERAIALLKGPS